MLYLDYAATAPIRANSLAVLKDKFTNDFANPSSAHKLGKKIAKEVEQTRSLFLKSLGANNYNFIFTSSATESNNTIIKGLDYISSDKVMACLGDHPSVLAPILGLKKYGVELQPLPLNDLAQVDEEKLLESLNDSVKLIVLTQVNSLSGNHLDTVALAKKIKENSPNVFIHVDAVQGFGKFPLDLSGNEIDSIAVSSHKIGGPKGVAGLFILKERKINPLLEGGGQEFGLRSSTLSGPLIFSFWAAFEEIFKNQVENLNHVQKIYFKTKDILIKNIPEIIFPFSEGGPYILSLILPGIPSDVLVRHLEMEDIYVASSSACSSKIKGLNPTFSALGIEDKYHKNLLRVSFGEGVTGEEIDIFSEKLIKLIKDLSNLLKK